MEFGDHRIGIVSRTRAVCEIPADEGFADDFAKPAADVGIVRANRNRRRRGRAEETLLESVERVCRFVLAKRSKQKAFRREVVGTQVFKRSQEIGLHRQDVVERYSKFR